MAEQLATNAQLIRAYEHSGGSPKAAALLLGISVRQVQRRMRKLQNTSYKEPEFLIAETPEDDVPVDELVEHRIKQFQHKKAHADASKLIDCKINIQGAIGILHFGDPHVDDDGTDLATLRAHSDMTHREGIYGANVGDTTNNWVGRLARLYSEQSTSASQAWKLAEWFIKRTRWLYMIGGNHDGWAGAGDPLHWIAKQAGAVYKPSSCRMRLNFPNGRQVIVNARHDFAGHSQYNPAHGGMKAAMFGTRDDILVSGHRHISGYSILKDPETSRPIHVVQVASYKVYDRYALERGFRDQHLGPAAFTVIDPALPQEHPDAIKCFWSPEEGADFLAWKRKR